MFESVKVIGSGRVGSAVAARLSERGVAVGEDGELVLLCVPDAAIPEVARGLDARALGGSRLRGDAPRSARSAPAALFDASAADVHARAGARAA